MVFLVALDVAGAMAVFSLRSLKPELSDRPAGHSGVGWTPAEVSRYYGATRVLVDIRR